jgi:hypothetical protein
MKNKNFTCLTTPPKTFLTENEESKKRVANSFWEAVIKAAKDKFPQLFENTNTYE